MGLIQCHLSVITSHFRALKKIAECGPESYKSRLLKLICRYMPLLINHYFNIRKCTLNLIGHQMLLGSNHNVGQLVALQVEDILLHLDWWICQFKLRSTCAWIDWVLGTNHKRSVMGGHLLQKGRLFLFQEMNPTSYLTLRGK